MPRIALALALSLLVGCGYTLVGRGSYLPDHIRKVAVPLLGNESYRYELATALTYELADRLGTRKELTIVDEGEADAILEGTIKEYSARPVDVDSQGTASTYRMTIRAAFRFRDVKQNRVLWMNRSYAFSQDYEVPADVGTREEAALAAQEEVVRDMADDVVAQLLEGF